MTREAPRVTAVVCTHNRAHLLVGAVDSLLSQDLPRPEFSVLVVDNASTDGTSRVLGDLTAGAENLRWVAEPRVGLSHARNRGWQETTAEIVAYLDDDAEAAPDWLRGILARFDREPCAGCVGGRVLPLWGAPRPAWLTDRLVTFLAILDLGDEPRPIGEGEWLAGANIAFRRQVLVDTGGFDPELGRRGECLLSMEEVVLSRAIQERGLSLVYDPSITVRHLIPPERLRRRWFLRRAFWQGVSDAIAPPAGKRAASPAVAPVAGDRPRPPDEPRSGFRRLCGIAHRAGFHLTRLRGRSSSSARGGSADVGAGDVR